MKAFKNEVEKMTNTDEKINKFSKNEMKLEINGIVLCYTS